MCYQQVLVAEATISSQEERLEGGRRGSLWVLVSPVMMWVNITQDSQGGKEHLYQSECFVVVAMFQCVAVCCSYMHVILTEWSLFFLLVYQV